MRSLLGFSYFQLRSIPVCVFGMSIEQNSQLVHSLSYVLLDYLPVLFRRHLSAADCLQRRDHRVLAWVVGVMTRRPVNYFVTFSHGKIVRNRNRLVMSHQKTILRSKSRTPTFDGHVHSWFGEVDGRLTAFSMLASIAWHPFLVSTPA